MTNIVSVPWENFFKHKTGPYPDAGTAGTENTHSTSELLRGRTNICEDCTMTCSTLKASRVEERMAYQVKPAIKFFEVALELACLLIFRFGGGSTSQYGMLWLTDNLNDSFLVCIVTLGAFLLYSAVVLFSYVIKQYDIQNSVIEFLMSLIGACMHFGSGGVIFRDWKNDPDDEYKGRATAISLMLLINGLFYLVDIGICLRYMYLKPSIISHRQLNNESEDGMNSDMNGRQSMQGSSSIGTPSALKVPRPIFADNKSEKAALSQVHQHGTVHVPMPTSSGYNNNAMVEVE